MLQMQLCGLGRPHSSAGTRMGEALPLGALFPPPLQIPLRTFLAHFEESWRWWCAVLRLLVGTVQVACTPRSGSMCLFDLLDLIFSDEGSTHPALRTLLRVLSAKHSLNTRVPTAAIVSLLSRTSSVSWKARGLLRSRAVFANSAASTCV